jgi:hypothetical protein
VELSHVPLVWSSQHKGKPLASDEVKAQLNLPGDPRLAAVQRTSPTPSIGRRFQNGDLILAFVLASHSCKIGHTRPVAIAPQVVAGHKHIQRAGGYPLAASARRTRKPVNIHVLSSEP